MVAQLVKNLPAMEETWFNSWVGKIPWRRDRLPTPVCLGFPVGLVGKESACNAGDLGLIPGLGRSPEDGMATHSSILAWKIPMDREGYSIWSHKESDITKHSSAMRTIKYC